MEMKDLFVADTNAIIRYFKTVFNVSKELSTKAKKIISDSFDDNANIRLSIPSVVFLEIFEKWCRTSEQRSMIYYDVFIPIRDAQNIEIKPIDIEVLENLIYIGGELNDHDIHDKLVLASAMMLDCPLITSDAKIRTYVDKTRIIPGVFS